MERVTLEDRRIHTVLFPCLDLVDDLYNVQMCTNTFFQDVSTYYKLDPKKANKWEYSKTKSRWINNFVCI